MITGALADFSLVAICSLLLGSLIYILLRRPAKLKRKAAENSLRLAAMIFENSAEGIMITDVDQHILLVNNTFTRVTGYTQEEVVGRRPDLLDSGQHDAAFFKEMMSTLHSEGSWQGEIINRRKDGKIYPEWLTLGLIRNKQGDVTHYFAMFSDISSRKRAEEKLNFLINYDVLTSLPNRRLFTDRLEQAIAAVKRSGGHIALFYLDPDRLKTINDTLGHAAGDELLRLMATRIGEQLRPGDTVARLNGDVFAILASDIREESHAALLAEQILTALHRPFIINGSELFINSSIGISVFPTDTENIDVLHQHADTALHQAKMLGGNNFQFFTADMNVLMVHRLNLENSLRKALEREEFELYYQPQVNIVSGEVTGAEVLLRWRSPELGLVTPTQFIGLAEETGLIVPIGKWVLRTACAQAVAWMKQGQKPLCFTVNLSARQFREGSLGQTVADALQKSGLPPSLLELELTESVIMEKAEETIATLQQLHAMGILISIDDFGTGYSSLSYLKRLPIQILKIDQSFVRDLDTDGDDKAIVSAVVALAHSLQLKVIAEGVETAAQLAYLKQIGCDVMQGYYYSRPLKADDFHELLTRSLLDNGDLGGNA
jgi:diguanylate cyclase (GGDEF)-like protein/PAS domain S-box-containing protein